MKNFILILIIIFLLIIKNNKLSNNEFNKKKEKNIWKELSISEQKINKINIESISPIIKKIEPAILIVNAIKKQKKITDNQKTGNSGTGFIINKTGLALTNYHIIEDSEEITVKVGNSLREFKVEVIGGDKNTDIALIQIQSYKKKWPTIPLGDSKKMQIGDFTIAIGNPLGLELSVSMGIISARSRKEINPAGQEGFYDFIQIDNAINPGNSGGPLINLNGEVIGINTAISAQGQGIGFSIPINQVKKIIPQLIKKGILIRAWLGIVIVNVNPSIAKAMGLPYAHGALIREITKNGPANKAELKLGDIIINFDNKIIKTVTSLKAVAGMKEVEEKVDLIIIRKGKEIKKKIILEQFPSNKKIKNIKKDKKDSILDKIGIKVTNINEKDKKKINILKFKTGIKIKKVIKNSIANFYGIKINDIITKIDETMITDKNLLKECLNKINYKIINIHIVRDESKILIIIPKEINKIK